MENWKEPKVFAVKHKDYDTRMASRSGGIFTALSDIVLSCGGVVYGCVLTEEFKAVHIRAVNFIERDKMRGSKYIQSNMGNIYSMVQRDLLDRKKVLFSGTSCQISGLKSFLGQDFQELICVDIVCHGVPSPLVWSEYLKWQENRNNSKCIEVDFRNKRDYGWEAHIESLKMDNGNEEIISINSKVFTTLFYEHSILRPCCYKCPYKASMHPGDITIADYWGIDIAAPGFSDNNGVSLVLINNEYASTLFEQVKKDIEYKETRLEDSLQDPLIKPFKKPKEREKFWEDFRSMSFDKVARKYGGHGWKNILKRGLGKILRKVRIIE